MCIHERQLLLESFLFNNYFYFFATISRFHCDIGCSLFLSGDTPLEFSVTLFLFEELQVTFSWEVIGLMTGFNVSFLFLCNGHAGFQSGDLYCSYPLFLHSNRNDLFLAAGQCKVTLLLFEFQPFSLFIDRGLLWA